MTSLNSSYLKKTLILAVSIVLCLVSSAFGDDSFSLNISKVVAGGCVGAQCVPIPTNGSTAADVPAQNVAITPYVTVPVGSSSVTVGSIATDPSGRIYLGNGNAVLRVRGTMRTIFTVAGTSATAAAGYADGAATTSAMFSGITALATDAVGNVYIADAGNHAIRMLNPETNSVCTIAASSVSGATGCGSPWGNPMTAQIGTPLAMAVGNLAGNAAANLIYFSDVNSNIYQITPSGITRVAGTGTAGYAGDGGLASAAKLNLPLGLALDGSGNLYIADSGNNLIREMTASGNMVLVAGLVSGGVPQSGNAGSGVTAVGAPLSNPTGIMLQVKNSQNGPDLQIVILDTGNHMIRGIEGGQMQSFMPVQTPSGTPVTAYGLSAIPNGGVGVDVVNSVVFELGSYLDSGAAYVGTSGAPSPTSTTYTAMLSIQQAMTIQSIAIPSLFQSASAGFSVGTISCTNGSVGGTTQMPAGTTCSIPITFTPGRPGLRKAPLVMTYNAGSGTQVKSGGMVGYGLSPSLGMPGGMSTFANFSQSPAYLGGSNNGVLLTGATYDTASNFFVTTGGNNTVWMYNSGASPQYQLVAGQSGVAGYGGDGGAAINAQLNNPSGIAEDPAGNLYIADTGNCRIREISYGVPFSNGTIQTILGNSGACVSAGDGGDAGSASTVHPKAIYTNVYGDVYFAEDTRVRVINADTNIVSTYAGGGTSTADGIPATQAQLAGITAIFIDRSGNLYIALGPTNPTGPMVRKVDSFGYITTLPATVVNPVGVATDASDMVYIADAGNFDVLRVDLNNNVSVVAGIKGSPGSGCDTRNGIGSTSTALGPLGLLVSSSRGDILFLNTNPSNSYVCQINFGFGGSRYFTFSDTAVGNLSTMQPALYNNGNLPMPLSGNWVSVTQNTGTPSGTFSEIAASGTDCANVTGLPIGSSCNVKLQFHAPAVQTAAYTGTLQLTDGAFDSPDSITLYGTSIGAESKLAFSNAPYSGFTIGNTPPTFTVQVEDSNGNGVPSTDSISLTVTFPDGVTTWSATQAAGSNGSTNFTPLAGVFTQTGTYVLLASDVTNSNVTSASGGVTVNAKQNNFAVAAPSSVTAGQQFSFSVTALTYNGVTPETNTNYTGTVSFFISGSASGAALPGPYVFTAANQGQSPSLNATLVNAGTVTLTATDSSNNITGSTQLTVQPGPATRLNINNYPSNITAGQSFPVTVTAQDNWGNTAPGYTGTVQFSSDDPAAQFSPASGTLTNGVGVFGVTLNSAGIHYVTISNKTNSLQATVGPFAVAGSSQTSTNISLALSTSTANPGQVVTLTATVQNNNNGTAVTAGSVTFWENGQAQLGTVQVVSSTAANNALGTATLRRTFPANSCTGCSPWISATYNGTKNIAPSTSNGQQLNINSLTTATTTTLTDTVDLNNSANYDFTAAVSGAGGQMMNGQVTFQDLTTSSTLGNSQLFGSFGFLPRQAASLGAGVQPRHLVPADFNGDGIMDVAVIDDTSGKVLILLGKGDGTFQSPVAYPAGSSPNFITAGDLNGDGLPDLVVVNTGAWDSSTPGTVNVLLNDPQNPGHFKPPVQYTVGLYPMVPTLVDVNGDGILDLLVPNFCPSPGDWQDPSTVSVLIGNGDGTFKPQQTYPAGAGPEFVQVAGFNSSGAQLLAVGNEYSGVTILAGDGTGKFTTGNSYPIGTNADVQDMVVADFNGDGRPDIAVANGPDNSVYILLADPQNPGQFLVQTQSYQIPNTNTPSLQCSGYSLCGLLTADFNNDGAPDLIAQNWGNGSVTLLINQSQWTNPQQPGLFNLSGTYSVGSPGRNSIGYLAADFNGDGIPDLVVSNETDGTIGILPGAMVGSSTVMNVSVTGGSGSHQIQASFSPNGGSNYTSSVSNILSVASMIMSQLTLYPSPTYTYGISGSVSACIMQPIGAPVPTGTFTYSIDTIPQGSPVPLMPGCTQLPLGTTLAIGGHTISVGYSGDANYTPAGPQTATVNIIQAQAQATTALSANPTTISTTGSTVLTATVTGTGSVIPFGMVTFYNGSSQLGSPVGLVAAGSDSSTATLTVYGIQLAVGGNSISASYGGDVHYGGSGSSQITVTVNTGGTGGISIPVVLSLSPATATTGGAEFTLTVYGANFTGSSLVLWNGAVRATTYVNNTQLTASILPTDIATTATNEVSVASFTPAATSAAMPFAVISDTPVPTVNGSTIAVATDSFGNHVLTLTGTNFISGSSVLWNGASVTAYPVSNWQISATISGAQFATRPSTVTVSDPGGTSAAFELR